MSGSNRVSPMTRGAALVLFAGAMWSLGTVLARVADRTDAFQYLVWRSIGVIIVIELFSIARGHPWATLRAFTSGRRVLAACAMLWLASIGFVYAVKTTSAANAAFLGSTSPLFGVFTARWFLGERITARTLAVIAVALAGLAVMVAGDVDVGNMERDAIAGDVAALLSGLGFALYTTIVRSAPRTDWSPVLPGYGVMMIVICGAITATAGNSLVPDDRDIALALLHGGIFIVGGTLLYNRASHDLPAAAMTVFAQTEMVLVPIWAMLLLSERPSVPTLIGGALIMIAVLARAALETRRPITDDIEVVPAA